MTKEIPHVIIDWDYDTFDVADDGVTYFLYDLEPNTSPEYVYLTGYPYPGKVLENALAKRVDPNDKCKYRLVPDEALSKGESDDRINCCRKTSY